MEGDPDQGFVYLIGMMVCDGQSDKRFSFWVDNKDQELHIFEQFLGVVAEYDTPSIFCYGGYERVFIKRMRQHARRKKFVDKSVGRTYQYALDHLCALLLSNLFQWPKRGCWIPRFLVSGPAVSGLESIAWRICWVENA